MKYLLVFLLGTSSVLMAEENCFTREFDERLEEVGEVTSEESNEISEFCSQEEQESEQVGY